MTSIHNAYSRARLDDRQMTELVGIARGLMADGRLNDDEIVFFTKWLAANEVATANPVITLLLDRLIEIMSDNVIDDEERAELEHLMGEFAANDFEVGEVLKPTSLPLCTPAPEVTWDGQRFTFTGTFTFGSRKDCEAAATERGAQAGSLTQGTRYLVIGEYATDSWAQSSWGRKIEKAADMRARGVPVAIISENHWREFL